MRVTLSVDSAWLGDVDVTVEDERPVYDEDDRKRRIKEMIEDVVGKVLRAYGIEAK